MNGLQESATKSRRWPVWTGTITDLRRILRVVEAQYQPLLSAHVEEATVSARRALRRAEEDVARWQARARELRDPDFAHRLVDIEQGSLDRARREFEEKRAKAEHDGRIKLTLKYSDDEKREVIGTADELSDYLEDKSARSLEFEAPSGYMDGGRITLTAGTSLFVDGVAVRVSSSDSRWAAAALSQMEDEVSKGVPRWRWIRSLWFLIPFYLTCLLLALVILSTTNIPGVTDVRNRSAFLAVTGFLVPSIALGGAWLARRYVRAFELVSTGGRSRGGRVVGAVGSGIAAIALGVIVNLIS